MVDIANRPASGIKELQEAADLLGRGFLERLQNFRLVIVGQAALALGQAGFLVGQPVAAHNLFG